MSQVFYRLDQFRRARTDTPSDVGLARAAEILSPKLYDLFSWMLPFEQAHAIRVMEVLEDAGHDDPDLLAAALLHDVGKVRHPLHPWERGLAVLVKAILPEAYQKWSGGEPDGLRAGMVVAAQHAAWGAEMAAEAGADPKVVWLIANHDADLGAVSGPDADKLGELQRVDAVS